MAGIPPEAREAARAAARREGLSVGEWLTRRILRSFADAGDEDELTRDSYATSRTYRTEEPAPPPSSRETDEMLDRVSRSAAETNDVYRRIEEQLRGVARRMESQERNQTENNRAMSKAATEMNIAAREQAQAFDQMGAHVVGLADRIARVESANAASGLKDAVKGLHTGLSRLADQITQNAGQSAQQISQLAGNLEAVAVRLGQQRDDVEGTARSLDQRIMTLDDRLYSVEKASQSSATALERALETLNARIAHDQDNERRDGAAQNAIARLEENVTRLEARGSDPEIERRLGAIEQNLGNLIEKLEGNEPTTAKAIEDSLRKLVSRVEATENRQRDSVSEFRAALNETNQRLASMEVKTPPPPVAAPPMAAPAFAAAPAFDAPPFPDVPTPGAPPPFQAQNDPFAPAQTSFDALPPFADDPFAPAQHGDAFAAAPAQADSFLSAARRSARAAASAAEAEQVGRGFAWGAKNDGGESPKRTRYVVVALGTLIVIVLIAAFALSQGMIGSRNSGLGALFAPKTETPAPQAGTPLHAVLAGDDTVNAPKVENKPTIVAPLVQKPVSTSPIHTVPPPAATTTPQNASAAPPPDRLTALANGGNAKAELIVGLKYLNGDGVPVNKQQGAKWLERAAEAGEPVAQYSLGNLYQRGEGVPADAAKATHWYQAAAMQGHRKAMYNLAIAYHDGVGIKKDFTEAARWFSKAASFGFADAEFNLAVLYERGEGVPQSLLDAYKWYAIAAAGGDTESKARVDALSTQLSADDRAAAQRAADSFKPAALDPRANVAPQAGDLG